MADLLFLYVILFGVLSVNSAILGIVWYRWRMLYREDLKWLWLVSAVPLGIVFSVLVSIFSPIVVTLAIEEELLYKKIRQMRYEKFNVVSNNTQTNE